MYQGGERAESKLNIEVRNSEIFMRMGDLKMVGFIATKNIEMWKWHQVEHMCHTMTFLLHFHS